jgi:hypothetical protein
VDLNEKTRFYVRPAVRVDYGTRYGLFTFCAQNTQHKYSDFSGTNIDLLCTGVCHDLRKGREKKHPLLE